MSVTMRIVQQYDIRHEKAFLDLERKFAELEAKRPDYPKGRRMKPIAAGEPCNTLVWECSFPDLASARDALSLFEGDAAHDELLEEQVRFFKQMRVEFYEDLHF